MRKNVILLEILPNYISSVVQTKNNDGNVHGYFDSDEILTPVYWSERGVSKVYLRDIQIVDPKKYRPLSISSLQTAMPEFNWSPGPSGRRITGPYIRIIRRMWKKYLEMNET